MAVARILWRAWEWVVAFTFPLMAGVLLATRFPVPLLGAEWWPLWTISWVQACFVLRYAIRRERLGAAMP